MEMDFVGRGVEKYGSPAELHKALIRAGVNVSYPTINNAFKGITKSLNWEVQVAIVHLVFNGDWKAAGKVIEADVDLKLTKK